MNIFVNLTFENTGKPEKTRKPEKFGIFQTHLDLNISIRLIVKIQEKLRVIAKN